MTSFKEKYTKPTKQNEVIVTTLDTQHKKRIEELMGQTTTLDKLKKKHAKMIAELDALEGMDRSSYTPETLTRKSTLKNGIEELEQDIARLENETDLLDYFDGTYDILTKYYDEESDNTKKVDVCNITDIFKIKNDVKNERYQLYERYMKMVHNQGSKRSVQQLTMCTNCKCEKIFNSVDGLLVCMQCGETDSIFINGEKSSNKDHSFENKANAYKRINHMSEILNQFQAKESTEIPDLVFQQIQEELKKQRITDIKSVTHKQMRLLLKKLRLNRYYEHVHHIINKLNGVPPPVMSRETEEQLKQMFKQIQKPFMMFRPKNRSNFLSYNYVIHKLCQLLELDEFLPYFSLLKSRDKLEEQDAIWEKICRFMNYQFIPSV